MPSSVNKIYWKYTRSDIKVKLRLYLGQKQAEAVQQYENLALIANQLFGDGKKHSENVVPKTEAEMVAAFGAVFGKKS